MKKQFKRFSICILMLLFASSQPTHAAMWSRFTLPESVISTATKKFISNNKYAISAVSTVAVVAFSYLFYKWLTSPLYQVKVLRQSDNSACGYHALYNAKEILHSLNANQDPRKNTNLNNRISFDNFYHPQRRFIKGKRFEENQSYDFWNNVPTLSTLKTLLSPDQKKQLLQTCRDDNFYEKLTNELLSGYNSNYLQTYQRELEKLQRNENLSDEELAAVEQNKIKWIKTNFSIPMPHEDLYTKLIDEPHAFSYFYGHWLDFDEIQNIIDQSLADSKVLITVLNAPTQIDTLAKAKQNALKTGWQKEKEFSHAFIIAAGLKPDDSTVAGHWITVVLHKHEGKKYIYVADSYNTPRTLNDASIKGIVDILNSPIAPAPVS